MDINDFRAWHTVVLFVCFIGIIVWAYSRRRKGSFDEAANLPFADEIQHETTMKKENQS